MTAVPDDATRVDVSKGASTPVAAPDPRRWLALAIIAVSQLMVVLDASIVNVALPSIEQPKPTGLGVNQVDGQWVITAYALAFGSLLLLGGRIADYVGRKRMFLIGLIGFAGASALGGAAVNGGMLFGARALQGAFAALLAPAALSLITVSFTDAKERAKAFGVYGAISGGGAAIGLILGGVLTEYLDWRWCLFVNVPIAIVAAVAGFAVVHESKATGNTKYDIPGAVLITGGLVALVYGFTEAAKEGVGWTATSTLVCLAIAVVALVAFVVVEARSPHALLPLWIVLDRNRGAAYLTSLLIGAGLFAMFLFLTYYFQINLQYSPVKAGLAFLPFSGGIIVTAGLASSLLPRFGPKPLMVVGGVLATLGLFYLTQLEQDSSWAAHVLPSELIMSIGMALVFVPLASLSLVGIGGQDAGVASAMLNTTQQVGGALGTALLSTLFISARDSKADSYGISIPQVQAQIVQKQAAPQDVMSYLQSLITGYHHAFFIGAILIGAATLVTAVIVRAKKDDVSATEGAIIA
ncbi:MFS transporter [Jatrophihabitans sp. YIM 134969]